MKYTCRKCGQMAHYMEFYKNQDSRAPQNVYTYCKTCGIEAWGGLTMHPEMNDFFNTHFQPKFDGVFDDAFGKKIILQE